MPEPGEDSPRPTLSSLSRREFLELAGMSLGAIAFARLPPEDRQPSAPLARATTRSVTLHTRPDPGASVVRMLERDEVLHVLEEVNSPRGPEGNPYWFRLPGGFVHTGDMQPVREEFNVPVAEIPAGGLLTEVTVPYSQSRVAPQPQADPLYRLYYGATFWVMGLAEDAQGRIWYEILDDRLYNRYYARAEHLRPVYAGDLQALSSAVPGEAKRIEVDLARQTLVAYEFERPVLSTLISGGRLRSDPDPGKGRTFTPIGEFRVNQKMPSRHMGDGRVTSQIDAHELPGVPWITYFTLTGIAFHGVYWHNDFGRRRSEGCVNMRPPEARWLYCWTQPTVPLASFSPHQAGTRVTVTE